MRTLIITLAILIPSGVLSQAVSTTTEKPQLNVVTTQDPMVIDGKLDEKIWAIADTATAFYQVEPNQGNASEFRTIVRVVQGHHGLYFGVICFDPEGKKGTRATDLKRDFNWRDHDTFAIAIDGFNDQRNSMSFVTNPYGAQRDYLSFDDIYFDVDWSGLWKVRTHITEEGWVAEFELPWKTLRYTKPEDEHGSTWGLNFLRLRRASNEISVWSPYPRSFGFNRMDFAGQLTGLKPPPPSTNFQLNTYTLANDQRLNNNTPSTSSNNDIKIGGDAKWVINPNKVLDITFNTDFAQADADAIINNTSRFSVLFPERRQFFLENASLFGPGLSGGSEVGGNMAILPFFSRRIGLNENGQPIPLKVGTRFTHRSLKSNYGVMTVRQSEDQEEASNDFVVGRYSHNLGSNGRVGSIFTLKTGHMSNDASNQDKGVDWVAGMDGFFRWKKTHSLSFMALQSSNETENQKGYGAYLQYLYTNNNLQAWWTQSVVTDAFNPSTGFLSRRDVISSAVGFQGNIRGSWLPFRKQIRAFKPGISTEVYHQTSSKAMVEQTFAITPLWLEFNNGGQIKFTINPNRQSITGNFEPLGVTIGQGDYHFLRYSMQLNSDASKKVAYTMKYNWGAYFNGQLSNLDLSLNFAPMPQFSLNIAYGRNKFREVGERLESPYVDLYTVQGRLALNPRIQLTGMYQNNSVNNTHAYNLRFVWEYSPLSYVFLVFNKKSYAQDFQRQTDQSSILKLTFLKQF